MSLETINFQDLPLQAGDRVLDLGCGEGRHAISAFLTANVDVVGIDLNRSDLETAQARLAAFRVDAAARPASCAFVHSSGHRLPFADDSFDHVICAEVLEHIPDYRSFLAEIRRVLKRGGLLAVSVPRFFPEWVCWKLSAAYHQVEGGHVRIFRSKELRHSVESEQMRLYRKHWAHSLHVPYWWLRCLFWERGETMPIVALYHRFLVWDLMRRPALTRFLDRALNPLLGKSVVMYFVKEA